MSQISTRVFEATAKILVVSVNILTLETGVGDIPEWDSLGHTRLIAGIEESFDLLIDVEEALDLETIQDIVALVEEKVTESEEHNHD